MKRPSIAFCKAIVLSLIIFASSGFYALAAEGELVPQAEVSQNITDDDGGINELGKDELEITSGQIGNVERPEDDQIIVGINVNGIPREQGMTVFLPLESSLEDVLVPLGQISELMSFSIESNAGDKKAEGFFIKEENAFQLDLNTKEVLVNGQKFALQDGEAEIQEDDIYVKASSLEDWFGIKIKFDMSELVLNITSEADLPFQERMKRLLNAERRKKTYVFDPIKPENAQLAPYRNFSFPSIYTTTSVGARKSPAGTSVIGTGTLQGNQDIAKFEADYSFGTRYNSLVSSEISSARLTLQRRDVSKNLLGPLHAGRISLGDVAFPTVPLFLGGQRGMGVEVSSDSRLGQRYASNSENFILDGDAPVGWDAELYRNGAFIAFQQIGPDGRFVFENLNLNNGFNSFEIVLYGPQGQKTVIRREITRGARSLRKGEIQYDFAAGMPGSDLLPFSENSRTERTAGMSGQAFYGFTNFFTMGASVYSGPQDTITDSARRFSSESIIDAEDDPFDDRFSTTRSTGAAISASASFLGMNFQGQVLGADKGRRAYEAGVVAKPFGINLGLSRTEYKNFLEEDQDIKSRTEISASRNFGKFSTSLRVQQRDFLEREDDTIIENVTSFKFLGVNISNDLVRTLSKNDGIDDFEGEITALTDIYGVRFRTALIYDLDTDAQSRYRRISFSGQKSLTSRSSLRFEGAHEFDSDIDSLNLRFSRDFAKFGLDLDATANTDQNYSLTVGLRTALQPDQNNRYHTVDPRSGGLASLGARAFIDSNDNGTFDQDEILIENVQFKASTSSDKSNTDEQGVAYITNLGEAPVRLSVVSESIPDIYLAPKFDHRDLIPRRGSTPIIDFPFVKMSEISGYLVHLKRGLEGVVVRLINGGDGSEVEKTETDSDGYFIFPAVKGGNYKIAFGLPDREFMSLNVDLDVSIEDPEEIKVEASEELVEAAKEAAAVRPSASNAAQDNLNRLNGPAGAMPNIDDPLSEEDLKELDEKAIEGIITQ